MTRLDAPILLSTLVVPFFYALVVGQMPSNRDARRFAIGISTGVLLVATTLAIFFFAHPETSLLVDPISARYAGAARPLLGLDALSAPLLPLSAAIPLVVFVACPRARLDRRRVRTILLTEVAMLGLLLALDLALLATFWIAMLVPAWLDARRDGDVVLARTISRYQGIGAVALLAGVGVLATSGIRDHLSAPLVLREIVAHSVDPSFALVAAALLVIAVIARGSLFPTQAFLPTLFERGHVGVSSLLFVAQPAGYLVARVLLPLLPDAGATALSLVADLGLVTAIWGALLALAQHDLRRFVGALATSQSGLLLIGLCSTNAQGLAGGLVYWVASSIALAGLALVVGMVQARTGTTDVRRLGGIARTMPHAASLFLVFGVSAIGLPGTLAFIGEELLVHGVLESYPWVGAVLLVATLLNAIAFFKVYSEGFVGARRLHGVEVPPGRDLSARERFAVIGLVIALVAFGLLPKSLVHARELAAESTLSAEAQHGQIVRYGADEP